jgi:hypothetical protein
MYKTSLVLASIVFCVPALAQESGSRWEKRLWKASIAAVAAGSIVDMQSSLGKHETNGILANHQGVFSMQGIGIKLAIAGATLGTQHYILHKHPTVSGYKSGAFINFAVAGALGGVAAHNYGNRPVQ